VSLNCYVTYFIFIFFTELILKNPDFNKRKFYKSISGFITAFSHHRMLSNKSINSIDCLKYPEYYISKYYYYEEYYKKTQSYILSLSLYLVYFDIALF